jgi:hypothetical protein
VDGDAGRASGGAAVSTAVCRLSSRGVDARTVGVSAGGGGDMTGGGRGGRDRPDERAPVEQAGRPARAGCYVDVHIPAAITR